VEHSPCGPIPTPLQDLPNDKRETTATNNFPGFDWENPPSFYTGEGESLIEEAFPFVRPHFKFFPTPFFSDRRLLIKIRYRVTTAPLRLQASFSALSQEGAPRLVPFRNPLSTKVPPLFPTRRRNHGPCLFPFLEGLFPSSVYGTPLSADDLCLRK